MGDFTVTMINAGILTIFLHAKDLSDANNGNFACAKVKGGFYVFWFGDFDCLG